MGVGAAPPAEPPQGGRVTRREGTRWKRLARASATCPTGRPPSPLPREWHGPARRFQWGGVPQRQDPSAPKAATPQRDRAPWLRSYPSVTRAAGSIFPPYKLFPPLAITWRYQSNESFGIRFCVW